MNLVKFAQKGTPKRASSQFRLPKNIQKTSAYFHSQKLTTPDLTKKTVSSCFFPKNISSRASFSSQNRAFSSLKQSLPQKVSWKKTNFNIHKNVFYKINNNNNNIHTLNTIATTQLFGLGRTFSSNVLESSQYLSKNSLYCKRSFSKFATEAQAEPASKEELTKNSTFVSPEDQAKKPTLLEMDLPDDTGSKEQPIPAHVESIVDQITKLNFIEQLQLMKAFAARLGIPFDLAKDLASGNVAAPAAAAPSQAEEKKEEAPPAKKKQKLVLVSMGEGAKYKVLKELKTLIPGKSITEYKNYVEKLPQTLVTDTNKEEAEKWMNALKPAGAVCELQADVD